jgi:hypothetical protein
MTDQIESRASDTRRRGFGGVWWLGAAVFVCVFAFRFLTTKGFHNDQFMHLAYANQVLGGEVPVRDFVDAGMPLTYLISAAAQIALGRTPLAEALLSVMFLALGAALTFGLAARVSGSFAVGVVMAVIQVIIAPRLYSYPKIVLPLWAAWLFWRYADRPARSTAGWLVAATVIAFLMRHDHGLLIGLGSLALIAAAHAHEGVQASARRAAQFAAAVVVTLLPFLLFVQANGGLVTYLRDGLAFRDAEQAVRRLDRWPAWDLNPWVFDAPEIGVRWSPGLDSERRTELEARHSLRNPRLMSGGTWGYDLVDPSSQNVRELVNRPEVEDTVGIDRSTSAVTGLRWSALDRAAQALGTAGHPALAGALRRQNAIAWLYRVFVLLPVAAILALLVLWRARPRRRGAPPLAAAAVLGTVVLVAATNYVYLRDPLEARLSDASAVTLVLAAWLIGLMPRIRRDLGRWRLPLVAFAWTLVAAMAAVTVVSAADLGDLDRMMRTARLSESGENIADRVMSNVRELGARPPIDGWLKSGDERRELKRLAQYVRECSAPSDHLLVTWFEPELYYYSERRFAAGIAFFHPGFFTSPAQQQRALARLRAQSVPIAIVEEGRNAQFFSRDQPLLAAYLAELYRPAATVAAADGQRYAVLIDKRAAPVRSYGPWGLPCFR